MKYSSGQRTSPQCSICEAFFSEQTYSCTWRFRHSPNILSSEFFLVANVKSALTCNYFLSVEAKMEELSRSVTSIEFQPCFEQRTACT